MKTKEKKFDVFSFVKDLSYKKEYLYNEETEGHYNPFIINRAFSYYADSIFHSNKMNMAFRLSHEMQHDFYFHSLRKRSRFTPWHKKDEALYKELKAVAQYFDYSINKAREVRRFIPDEFVKSLIEKYEELEKK